MTLAHHSDLGQKSLEAKETWAKVARGACNVRMERVLPERNSEKEKKRDEEKGRKRDVNNDQCDSGRQDENADDETKNT